MAEPMTHPPELVEAMAMGLRRPLEAFFGVQLAPIALRTWAAMALDAIPAAGFAVVPLEPTEEMQQAGWIDKEDVDPKDIYRAMIATRPGAPQP